MKKKKKRAIFKGAERKLLLAEKENRQRAKARAKTPPRPRAYTSEGDR